MGKGFQHHIWAEYVYEQNTSGEVGCVQWICLAHSHASCYNSQKGFNI